ncbi:MAG: PAS domain S-box protein [Deltaproteobacteria bacterium]|jgi:PAS domain S-box-containing protein|nr:PAS domain S-box protein [Deltaproteobacteria bacterium]
MDDKRFDELEAKLEIYKSTLTEIYERYDQKLEELSLVRRLGDALRTTLSVETLAQSLMHAVAHEIIVDRLALLLKDPADGSAGGWSPPAPGGLQGAAAPAFRPEATGAGGRHEGARPALRLRAAYWTDTEEFRFFEGEDAPPWHLDGPAGPEAGQGVPRLLVIPEAPASADPLGRPGEGPRALVLAPFLVRHRFLGLMVLSRPAESPFTPEHGHMLSIMADQASAALNNVQLFDDLSSANAKLIESERRARESSSYLERLLETANDAILTIDGRGAITYANRKTGQWGWTKAELLGRDFREFLEDDPALSDWRPGAPPPADRTYEAVLLNAAGERRTVLVSTSKAGDPGDGGGAESWMLMASDLTERRQLERQLLHSEKLASIGILAAGVAHEVGNPLSTISGYAQILGAGAEDEAERREYISAILTQTERIRKILKELLDYSRPSRGIAETLDLAEHVPRIMRMLEAQRVFARIRTEYSLDPGRAPHLVTMDRDHLAQVVVIVAMNAAQAMAGQEDPAPRFTVALSREPGRVILALSDNGPGMPEDVRRRVYDPFFTTKGPGQGTGLGLAICQRIVDSYRGSIELSTAPGEGASFSISFPEAGG